MLATNIEQLEDRQLLSGVTAHDDTYAIDNDYRGQAVDFQVLSNDVITSGGTLQIDSAGAPSNGTVTVESSGGYGYGSGSQVLRYTPNHGFTGTDAFTYQVSDGLGNTDTAVVTVVVSEASNPNHQPVANGDTITVKPGETVSFDPIANDTDADQDTLSLVSINGASYGTLTSYGYGNPTYAAPADYEGTETLTYIVEDQHGWQQTGTVTVHVVNNLPTVVDDSYAVVHNQTLNADVNGSYGDYGVLHNDSDLDPQSLTASLVTGPTNGSLTFNSDGSFTYTPNNNYVGTDSFVYSVFDGIATVQGTATIDVTNAVPVVVNDAYSVDQDTTLAVEAPGGYGGSYGYGYGASSPPTLLENDSDADGDPLTTALVTDVVNGTLTLNNDGTFVYTPDYGFSGTDSFTYKVNDGFTDSTPATVTITVESSGGYGNTGPAATSDSYSVDKNTTLTVNGTAYGSGSLAGLLENDSDPDNDPLTANLVSGPANGSLTLNSDGTFVYTPGNDFAGTDSFTYQASDGSANSNLATVTITIVNTAPNVTSESITTDEDTAVNVDVLANDSDPDVNDSISVASVTQGTSGLVTVDAYGVVTYTPNANFNGSDSFTYTVEDESGAQVVGTVNVTVNALNDAPVGVTDSATTDKETAVTIDVLANDTDVENDPLTVSSVSYGSHGAVSVDGNGDIVYTPDYGYVGTDSFTYEVSDGTDTTGPITVNVTINDPNAGPTNSDPVVVDDSVTTNEDTAVTINVLANDSDPDYGDSISVQSVTQGTSGAVTVDAYGVVTYTPNADFNGSDSFTYTISDGNGGTDLGTVFVTVNPLADPPVGSNDSYTVEQDAVLTVGVAESVLNNDSDPDNDTLTAAVVGNPAYGTLTLNSDGTFTYTPDYGYYGSDSFTYTANDGTTDSNTATVDITVTQPGAGGGYGYGNTAPVAVNDTVTTDEDTPIEFTVTENDTDADNDILAVTAVTQGAHGTVVLNISDNSIRYTPDADFNGTDSFTYTVDDGNGGQSTATVNVTINAVNDSPRPGGQRVTIDEDSSATITLPATATDVDGDTLTVTSFEQPANGTLVDNLDGTYTYTPNADFSGSDSFRYTISDGNGEEVDSTVTVIVRNVNKAPTAVDDTATTDEDTPVTIDVLTNDSDPDAGTTLVVRNWSQGTNGTVSYLSDGTFEYTPDKDFNGTDTFTYTVWDLTTGQGTATVTVTVNAVNDGPESSVTSLTTNEDVPATLDALGTATDAESDAFSLTGTTNGAYGTVAADGYGVITYTPNAEFAGDDSFTYTLTDSYGAANTITVDVSVNAVNDPPDAVTDNVTTDEDTAVTVDVLANDTDAENATLYVTDLTDGTYGTVTTDSYGVITYTPDDDFNGADSFTYRVTDAGGESSFGTVNVTVNAVDDTPVVTSGDARVDINSAYGVDGDVTPSDTDADDETLTASVVSGPDYGTLTLNADGTYNYTPDYGFSGADSFTYKVNDGNNDSNTATVTITVAAPNAAPEFSQDSYHLWLYDGDTGVGSYGYGGGSGYGNTLQLAVTDADDASFTFALNLDHTTAGEEAESPVTIDSQGNILEAPIDLVAGDRYALTATVTDSAGNTDTAIVYVSVAHAWTAEELDPFAEPTTGYGYGSGYGGSYGYGTTETQEFLTKEELVDELLWYATFYDFTMYPGFGFPELGLVPEFEDPQDIIDGFLYDFPAIPYEEFTDTDVVDEYGTSTEDGLFGTFTVETDFDTTLTRTSTLEDDGDWSYLETLVSTYTVTTNYLHDNGSLGFTLVQTGSYNYTFDVDRVDDDITYSLTNYVKHDDYTFDLFGDITEDDVGFYHIVEESGGSTPEEQEEEETWTSSIDTGAANATTGNPYHAYGIQDETLTLNQTETLDALTWLVDTTTQTYDYDIGVYEEYDYTLTTVDEPDKGESGYGESHVTTTDDAYGHYEWDFAVDKVSSTSTPSFLYTGDGHDYYNLTVTSYIDTTEVDTFDLDDGNGGTFTQTVTVDTYGTINDYDTGTDTYTFSYSGSLLDGDDPGSHWADSSNYTYSGNSSGRYQVDEDTVITITTSNPEGTTTNTFDDDIYEYGSWSSATSSYGNAEDGYGYYSYSEYGSSEFDNDSRTINSASEQGDGVDSTNTVDVRTTEYGSNSWSSESTSRSTESESSGSLTTIDSSEYKDQSYGNRNYTTHTIVTIDHYDASDPAKIADIDSTDDYQESGFEYSSSYGYGSSSVTFVDTPTDVNGDGVISDGETNIQYTSTTNDSYDEHSFGDSDYVIDKDYTGYGYLDGETFTDALETYDEYGRNLWDSKAYGHSTVTTSDVFDIDPNAPEIPEPYGYGEGEGETVTKEEPDNFTITTDSTDVSIYDAYGDSYFDIYSSVKNKLEEHLVEQIETDLTVDDDNLPDTVEALARDYYAMGDDYGYSYGNGDVGNSTLTIIDETTHDEYGRRSYDEYLQTKLTVEPGDITTYEVYGTSDSYGDSYYDTVTKTEFHETNTEGNYRYDREAIAAGRPTFSGDGGESAHTEHHQLSYGYAYGTRTSESHSFQDLTTVGTPTPEDAEPEPVDPYGYGVIDDGYDYVTTGITSYSIQNDEEGWFESNEHTYGNSTYIFSEPVDQSDEDSIWNESGDNTVRKTRPRAPRNDTTIARRFISYTEYDTTYDSYGTQEAHYHSGGIVNYHADGTSSGYNIEDVHTHADYTYEIHDWSETNNNPDSNVANWFTQDLDRSIDDYDEYGTQITDTRTTSINYLTTTGETWSDDFRKIHTITDREYEMRSTQEQLSGVNGVPQQSRTSFGIVATEDEGLGQYYNYLWTERLITNTDGSQEITRVINSTLDDNARTTISFGQGSPFNVAIGGDNMAFSFDFGSELTNYRYIKTDIIESGAPDNLDTTSSIHEVTTRVGRQTTNVTVGGGFGGDSDISGDFSMNMTNIFDSNETFDRLTVNDNRVQDYVRSTHTTFGYFGFDFSIGGPDFAMTLEYDGDYVITEIISGDAIAGTQGVHHTTRSTDETRFRIWTTLPYTFPGLVQGTYVTHWLWGLLYDSYDRRTGDVTSTADRTWDGNNGKYIYANRSTSGSTDQTTTFAHHTEQDNRTKSETTYRTEAGKLFADIESSYGIPMIVDPNDPYGGMIPDPDNPDGYATTNTMTDAYGTDLNDTDKDDFHGKANSYSQVQGPRAVQDNWVGAIDYHLDEEFGVQSSEWNHMAFNGYSGMGGHSDGYYGDSVSGLSMGDAHQFRSDANTPVYANRHAHDQPDNTDPPEPQGALDAGSNAQAMAATGQSAPNTDSLGNGANQVRSGMEINGALQPEEGRWITVDGQPKYVTASEVKWRFEESVDLYVKMKQKLQELRRLEERNEDPDRQQKLKNEIEDLRNQIKEHAKQIGVSYEELVRAIKDFLRGLVKFGKRIATANQVYRNMIFHNVVNKGMTVGQALFAAEQRVKELFPDVYEHVEILKEKTEHKIKKSPTKHGQRKFVAAHFSWGVLEGVFVDGLGGTADLIWNAPTYAWQAGSFLYRTAGNIYKSFSNQYRLYYEDPLGYATDSAEFAFYNNPISWGVKGGYKVQKYLAEIANLTPEERERLFKGDTTGLDGKVSPELLVALEFASDVIAAIEDELTGLSDEEYARIIGRIFGLIIYEVSEGALLAAGTAGAGLGAKFAKLTKYLKKVAPGSTNKVFKIINRVTTSLAKLTNSTICFVAGTKVHTIDGLKKIEDIKEGDLVLTRHDTSTHEDTKPEYKPVLNTFVTNPDSLVHVEIEDDNGKRESFSCTTNHPFYSIRSESFIHAEDLEPGEAVSLPEGRTATVVGLKHEEAPGDELFTTYNFEVAETHTYFVGELGVWVHNASHLACQRLAQIYEKTYKKAIAAGKSQEEAVELAMSRAKKVSDKMVKTGVWSEDVAKTHLDDATKWVARESRRVFGDKIPIMDADVVADGLKNYKNSTDWAYSIHDHHFYPKWLGGKDIGPLLRVRGYEHIKDLGPALEAHMKRAIPAIKRGSKEHVNFLIKTGRVTQEEITEALVNFYAKRYPQLSRKEILEVLEAGI